MAAPKKRGRHGNGRALVVLCLSVAAIGLSACNGSTAAGSPFDNHPELPSCNTTDPCYSDSGSCFACVQGAGQVCSCFDAGPDASPYRSSCIGTGAGCDRYYR